jgi:glutathione S-transferase
VTASRGSAALIEKPAVARRRLRALSLRFTPASIVPLTAMRSKAQVLTKQIIMMILRSAAPSPFGRKVQIALSLLGFTDVKIEATDTMDAGSSLRQQNPLGKIPVLITEDGSAYYDSRVILEYLDDRAGGGKIIPRAAAQRFASLRLQALCDGILDASILTVYEGRWRPPEKHEAKWLDHQAGQSRTCACRARIRAAAAPCRPHAAACRADRTRLGVGLSRSSLRWPLARRSSAPCCLAR